MVRTPQHTMTSIRVDQLTPRQQSFVNLMAQGQLSATQAFIQAGYSKTGANAGAARLLAKVSIQQAIADKRKQLATAAKSNPHLLTPELVARRTAELMAQTDSPSAAVSATRLAADILGMTGGSQQQLPQALGMLLEGMRQAREAFPSKVSQPAIEASMRISHGSEESEHGMPGEQGAGELDGRPPTTT